MAIFNVQGITDAGKMLLATVQAGAIFDPTKLVVGSGNMPTGAIVDSMTAVVTPIKELEITKKIKTNDGRVIIGGIYSNADLTTAFYYRELALFARPKYIDDEGNETYGDEVLYSYGNAGENADLIPAHSTTTAVEKEVDVIFYVGNNVKVNLTIDSSVKITLKQAEELIGEMAVSKAGDVMSGSLGINTDGTDNLGLFSGQTDGAMVEAYTKGDYDNRRGLRVAHPDAVTDITKALQFYDVANGVWRNFALYGEHNKPTPTDVGAITFGTQRTAIPANSDLNNYTAIGCYKCSTNSNAATIANSPVELAFILDVISNTGAHTDVVAGTYNNIIQRLTAYSGEVYWRRINGDGTKINYGEWRKVYDSGNLTADSLGALPTSGGVVSGTVRRLRELNGETFESHYASPSAIEIDGEYTTAITHQKPDGNQTQFVFNEKGAALWNPVANWLTRFPNIAYGTYVGTGTYGKSNPNTLTFDFEPKLLIFATQSSNSNGQIASIHHMVFPMTFSEPIYSARASTISWNGNTVSWYHAEYEEAQLNASGKTYYYIAIG